MKHQVIWFDDMPDGPWPPGTAFPWGAQSSWSPRYREVDAGHRPPIGIVVPLRGDEAWEQAHPGECRGTLFGVDQHPTGNPDGGWAVTIVGPMVNGQPLDITVTPSLNAVGIWHGFVTNGWLTEDLG